MADPNTVSFFSRAWYGDEHISLTFPDGWDVHVLAPEPKPALTETELRSAFDHPIGSAPIRELGRGRKSAAVVLDDLSRPTPAADIIPLLLDELQAAGIPASQIRFVIGGGSHRPITQSEIVQKVGPQIADRYEVTNHDFMSGRLRGLGALEDGTPIFIDPVVVDADFKVCLGGIYPHGAVGFGGGAKLILPGVSGFATMFCYHTFYPSRGHAVIEAEPDSRDHRHVSEEVAAIVGLDVIVNTVLNDRRQVAGLFVGDYIRAHREAAHFALEAYGTRVPENLRREADLIVANCYPLDSDALQTGKGLWPRRLFESLIGPCSVTSWTRSAMPTCSTPFISRCSPTSTPGVHSIRSSIGSARTVTIRRSAFTSACSWRRRRTGKTGPRPHPFTGWGRMMIGSMRRSWACWRRCSTRTWSTCRRCNGA